ncbi:MAG: hypothetical protein RR797_06510, partial [Christensenella sp.]
IRNAEHFGSRELAPLRGLWAEPQGLGLSGHGRIISAPTVDESCAYAMAGDGLSLAGSELISTHVFF